MPRWLLGCILAILLGIQEVSAGSINVTQRRAGNDKFPRVVIERIPSPRSRIPSIWPPYGAFSVLENMFPVGRRTYVDDGLLAEENYVFNTLALPPNSPMPIVNGMHLPFPPADLESTMGDFGGHPMPLMETAASGQHAFVVDDWTRTPVATQLNPTWVGKMAVDNSLMDEFMARLQRGEVDLNNLRPIDPKLLAETNEHPVQVKMPVMNNQHHNHLATLRTAASLVMPEIWPANDAVRFANFIGHELPLDFFPRLPRHPMHHRSQHMRNHHIKPFYLHELLRQHQQPQHIPNQIPLLPTKARENFHRIHRLQHTINQSVIPTPPTEATPHAQISSDRSQQVSEGQKEQSGNKKASSGGTKVKKSTPAIFTYKLLAAAAEKRVRSTASTVAAVPTTTMGPEPTENSSNEP